MIQFRLCSDGVSHGVLSTTHPAWSKESKEDSKGGLVLRLNSRRIRSSNPGASPLWLVCLSGHPPLVFDSQKRSVARFLGVLCAWDWTLGSLGVKVTCPGLPSHPDQERMRQLANPLHSFTYPDAGPAKEAKALTRYAQSKIQFAIHAVSLGYQETFMCICVPAPRTT